MFDEDLCEDLRIVSKNVLQILRGTLVRPRNTLRCALDIPEANTTLVET